MTVSLEEAQSRLPDLRQLAPGEDVAITDREQVVARLVGVPRSLREPRKPGLATGMITIVADDDEHLKDFAEDMP